MTDARLTAALLPGLFKGDGHSSGDADRRDVDEVDEGVCAVAVVNDGPTSTGLEDLPLHPRAARKAPRGR